MLRLVLALVAVVAAAPASAVPITYFISGEGAGTIDDVVFEGRFTFALSGDTAKVIAGMRVPLDEAVLRIEGHGDAVLQHATRLGYNSANRTVFFGSTVLTRDVFDFFVDEPIDLSLPFAPLFGRLVFALGQFVDLPSSLGAITFLRSSDVQFSAAFSPVPLPAGAPLLLGALALGGVLAGRRRRA